MNKLNRLHYHKEYNYTEWRKDFFGNANVHDINSAAAEYAKKHPFAPTRITHAPTRITHE